MEMCLLKVTFGGADNSTLLASYCSPSCNDKQFGIFHLSTLLASQMLLHHSFSKRSVLVSVKVTLYENNYKNNNGKSSFSNINNFSWQKPFSHLFV